MSGDMKGVKMPDTDEVIRMQAARIVELEATLALTRPDPSLGSDPIPMVLFCPKCGAQHVDAPEVQKVPVHNGFTGECILPAGTTVWTNPPHRSHLCHCGCIWRPADVATVGVKAISTKGKADNFEPSPASLGLEGVRALSDIVAERKRQVEKEHWTTAHDDEHDDGALARAAAAYAIDAGGNSAPVAGLVLWPWTWNWWKPRTPRENLVRAGALIVAEIERLDRQALASISTPGKGEG